MPPVRRSRRLAAATRTVVEVVVERRTVRPPARSTADRLAAAAETARSWRARVTECADRAYSAVRGRIDWEAVTAELGLPLIGCLHMFDASLSAVVVRRLPDLADWSVGDERAMVDFVLDNFGTLVGDVWRLVGVYMNVSEADCLAAYRRLKGVRMPISVYESIKGYREDGVPWKDIHNMFPVYKSTAALLNAFHCANKRSPSVLGGKKAQAKWTPAETKRIKEILKQHYVPSCILSAVDAAVREFPDKTRTRILNKIRNHTDAVNQEVQRQRESGLDIDWVAVSWAVGLSELECLELCRIDEGKGRWTYDPDTFSKRMADRMEAFIAEHYPPPAAPNFNAVSNYMWVDISDCIRMAGMLRGEFEWTDEARARVVRMREQGMTYKEIARQLSPNLNPVNVAYYIRNLRRSRQHVPLTLEEKQRIRSIVDENSGKVSFLDVAELVKRAFAADKDQIARDILSGATTAAEVARRLDVPTILVSAMVDKFQSKIGAIPNKPEN
ncbi:hypothetical protein H4R18_000529 [Coemansia javaensis]|uniref:Myb-like domain-containing protein n=1 Tax=Coemansia javaensis TaxID=2761396 RepID=A0A9W8HJI2_9FUNG|nr:hypothetical protein H4R18_000529 [Coemansia javaensis]